MVLFFVTLLRCGEVRCVFFCFLGWGEVRIVFPYNSTVRCDAVCLRQTLTAYGAETRAAYGAVRCGFVRGKIVRCCAARLNRTEPHCTET